MSVRERIVTILRRQRRRLVAIRAAEAAAVGGIAGSLAAAGIMGGRILAGRYPLGAILPCVLVTLAGVIVAASRRGRLALHPVGTVGWSVGVLLIVSGAGATAAAAAGVLAAVPTSGLALLAGAFLIAPVVVSVAAGAPLVAVALDIDRRARLRERLSTAWQINQDHTHEPFADAVQAQALARIDRGELADVRFWSRTRKTAGALALSVLAAALMLLWTPLETPEAVRARRYGSASRRAAASIAQPLAALGGPIAEADADLAGQVRRLEELVGLLRQGLPERAVEWRGQVIELDELAAALREAARSGELDPTVRQRLAELADAVEHAADTIAAAMAESADAELATDAPATVPADLTSPEPVGWVNVFDVRYELATRPSAPYPPRTEPSEIRIAADVPFDEAWAAARGRAAESLRRQAVPAEYRQLVRDFFAVEDE